MPKFIYVAGELNDGLNNESGQGSEFESDHKRTTV